MSYQTRTQNVNGTHFTNGSQAAVNAHANETEERRAEEGEALLSTQFFSQLMMRFFMTFTMDGGRNYLYKDYLLSLRDNDNNEDTMSALPGSRVSCFTLELSHLSKYKCWDVKGETLEEGLNFDHVSDGASTLLTDADVPKHVQHADVLYQCFRHLPLTYIPAAEAVVKRCYKILTQQELLLFQLELADETIPSKTIRTLNPDSDMDRLVFIPGIVVAANRSYLKGAHVTARCKQCGHITQLKMPMWREGASLPKKCLRERSAQVNVEEPDQLCPMNPYEVLSEISTFLESQCVKFQERPEDIPVGDVPRSINLFCTGVHVRNLKPGMRKYILGVYSNFDSNLSSLKVTDRQLRSTSIHLLGIFLDPEDQNEREEEGQLTGPEFTQQDVNNFRAFSKRKDLLEVVSNSIAPSIYGHLDVKRSIACMLFGGTQKHLSSGNKNRADIHILLLGDPSVAKSQFLRFACNVAPRGVYTSGKGSSAAGLTAAIVKDIQGNFALEGGAMVLADGGIVCIDEFDKMRDDDRVAIHEAMEQQTISIAKAGITTVLGTKCSVLSAANPAFGSFDISKDTAEQHDFESTILSRFDLIWLIKDEKEYNKDRKIASHIFNLFLKSDGKSDKERLSGGVDKDIIQDPDGNDIVSINFLKKYLLYARSYVAPRLSQFGATRLENYYIEIREAARASQQRRVDQIPITVRQLESLVRLAESLAKMHLSSEVHAEHVEEAIRLFNSATVTASQSAQVRESLSEEEKQMVTEAEDAILRRVAINSRISKFTLCKDLMLHGYPSKWIQYAMVVLVKKGHLKEMRDSNILRVN